MFFLIFEKYVYMFYSTFGVTNTLLWMCHIVVRCHCLFDYGYVRCFLCWFYICECLYHNGWACDRQLTVSYYRTSFGACLDLLELEYILFRQRSPCASGGSWSPLHCQITRGSPLVGTSGLIHMCHRIGWWENLQQTPIFVGKDHRFL